MGGKFIGSEPLDSSWVSKDPRMVFHMSSDVGISYKVRPDGLEVLFKGQKYRELGVEVQSGKKTRLFLKKLKTFMHELDELLAEEQSD